MAIVRTTRQDIPERDPVAVKAVLAEIGIEYERWETKDALTEHATSDEVLTAYRDQIEDQKRVGGYVTADVIDIYPTTAGLESMLARFSKEHWHDEDEVRFIVKGRGIFYIHPANGDVTSIEVEAGDWIRVPRGTKHWFTLCGDRRIRTIRLFQDPGGWTPYYTDSRKELDHEPVCLGPAYLSSAVRM